MTVAPHVKPGTVYRRPMGFVGGEVYRVVSRTAKMVLLEQLDTQHIPDAGSCQTGIVIPGSHACDDVRIARRLRDDGSVHISKAGWISDAYVGSNPCPYYPD